MVQVILYGAKIWSKKWTKVSLLYVPTTELCRNIVWKLVISKSAKKIHKPRRKMISRNQQLCLTKRCHQKHLTSLCGTFKNVHLRILFLSIKLSKSIFLYLFVYWNSFKTTLKFFSFENICVNENYLLIKIRYPAIWFQVDKYLNRLMEQKAFREI